MPKRPSRRAIREVMEELEVPERFREPIGEEPPFSDPLKPVLSEDPLKDVPQLASIGRPKAVLDIAIIERAASIGCTMDEIAVLCGVSRDTMFARAKAEPEIRAAFDAGRDNGRVTLRRLQWHNAHKGSDTMLIWLGKQLLEQRDKAEVANTHRFPDATEDARMPIGDYLAEFTRKPEETKH